MYSPRSARLQRQPAILATTPSTAAKTNASQAAGAILPTTGWPGNGSAIEARSERRTIMNNSPKKIASTLGVALLLTAFGCQQSPEKPNDGGLSPQEQAIQNATRQLATETLGLKLEKEVTAGHKDNFSGLRTENITFTQRLDSRTFIAYDKRFSSTKESGMYKEADEALLKRSHELLDRLKIPAAEIALEKVVQEKLQTGERDGKTGKFKLEPVEPGKKW